MLFRRFLILFAISNCLITVVFPGFVKKYMMDIEQITTCPDNNHMESPLKNLKYVKVNHTHSYLSYETTYKYPMDESVGILMHLDRMNKKGAWSKIQFLPYQPNMCEYVSKYFKEVWVDYHRALGVKNPDKCPIPAGKYKLSNYTIDVSSIHIPFWVGKFRFSYIVQRDEKQKVLCMIFYASVQET